MTMAKSLHFLDNNSNFSVNLITHIVSSVLNKTFALSGATSHILCRKFCADKFYAVRICRLNP